MAIKGIDNLEQTLKQHNGEDAVISISHKLYGGQKIKCKFDCIIDENRIGFRVKSGQEIYVNRDEIISFRIGKKGAWFADDVMQVNIQF